jgi:hypothetical protein
MILAMSLMVASDTGAIRIIASSLMSALQHPLQCIPRAHRGVAGTLLKDEVAMNHIMVAVQEFLARLPQKC